MPRILSVMVLWQHSAVGSPEMTDGWSAFAGTQRSQGQPRGYVSQPAHAHLASELAEALLPEIFGELPPAALEAIREHDQGWAEPDLRDLKNTRECEPLSFLKISPQLAMEAWRRSIREAETRSALAGVIAARHFCLLAPDDATHAEFRATETAHYKQVERQTGIDERLVERATAALGFVDLLSLLLCAGFHGRVHLHLAHPADTAGTIAADSVLLELHDDNLRSSRPLFRPESQVELWRWRRGRKPGELLAESTKWAIGELLSHPEDESVTLRSDDERWMRAALDQARLGEQTPGGAQVGAVVVRDGNILCRGFNEGEGRHDPTAHAEMVVIRRLCAALRTANLRGCTLYCTLQPCGMCTMACLWAGVSRIVYGAGRGEVHAVYFESRHRDTTDFIADAFRNDLEVTGGVLARECAALYAKPMERLDVEADPAHGETMRAG